jgi:hypothetical protein
MTVESDIFNALKSLVSDRVFPDVAPLNTTKPYITYSQVGGEAFTYLERSVPSLQNGRFQVNVWGTTRAACSALMLQVESAMTISTTFQCKPIGAAVGSYDPDMLIYSSMQDFSVTSARLLATTGAIGSTFIIGTSALA